MATPVYSSAKRAADVPTERLDIGHLEVSAYVIPTDFPEADGTLAWNQTTLVVVEVSGGGKNGLGYTYADTATALLIKDQLRQVTVGADAMAIAAVWSAMIQNTRNLGRPGIVSMAIAAVDAALWDLKAKVLDLPLVSLLGQVRDGAPIYGSGGFTSYSDEQLQQQLGGWVEHGIPGVKMKVGTYPADDLKRVRLARKAIGPNAQLFVDANGAYSRKEALAFAQAFKNDADVTWFEEPVPSDDLEGLRLIRDHAPHGMDIAAGEYGYQLKYFDRMLAAGAVDVLQADASRCGSTGFLQTAALCESRLLPLSAHCAPSLHVHLGCAVKPLRHLEYFHDHVRIEQMLFDGAILPVNGELHPDLSRPGMGLEFKRADAAKFAV